MQVVIKPYCDPSKVKVTGPGLKGGKTNKPATFEIDASKAGEGGIGLTIEGPTEAEIKCDDHGDGTCSVEYLPVDDGDYTINVTFADVHVPGSPFNAVVSSDFDVSKVDTYFSHSSLVCVLHSASHRQKPVHRNLEILNPSPLKFFSVAFENGQHLYLAIHRFSFHRICTDVPISMSHTTIPYLISTQHHTTRHNTTQHTQHTHTHTHTPQHTQTYTQHTTQNTQLRTHNSEHTTYNTTHHTPHTTHHTPHTANLNALHSYTQPFLPKNLVWVNRKNRFYSYLGFCDFR